MAEAPARRRRTVISSPAQDSAIEENKGGVAEAPTVAGGDSQSTGGPEAKAGAASESTKSSVPGGRWRVAAVSLAVLALISLVAAVIAGVAWNAGRSADSRRDAALEAARTDAAALTTIDFNTAKQDIERVLSNSTGEFGELFRSNIDSYVGVLKSGSVVTKGMVVEAAPKDLKGDVADVLVAVKTNVKNRQQPNGEDRFYRMAMQMRYQDGKWLVARVDFVP